MQNMGYKYDSLPTLGNSPKEDYQKNYQNTNKNDYNEYQNQYENEYNNSRIPSKNLEQRVEKVKQSENMKEYDDQPNINITKSEFLPNERNQYHERNNTNGNLKSAMEWKMSPKPLTSTYKERKEYETNEELFNRNNQLRFSSLSMQLLGKTRKPLRNDK